MSKLKPLDQIQAVMSLQHSSLATEQTYVQSLQSMGFCAAFSAKKTLLIVLINSHPYICEVTDPLLRRILRIVNQEKFYPSLG